MHADDALAIGEVAARAGVTPSALRFYEQEGLLHPLRTAGGQRRYPRAVLRRIAFIRAAQSVGLSLSEVRDALASLPEGRNPTRADWDRLSRSWRARLDERIAALQALRDGLSSCIGCGCLSLQRCRLSNAADAAASAGAGARFLPAALRDRDGWTEASA
ncbi:redox-sensitive transcriptional activator SoxR [Kineococcus glutinatus]|uniref:Redox-sensitive transcriptional activator SoxR n=1 Tax=Kineococcus glutinatus TaxID=1070872 RepID=A0ABP9I098_9ACTN